MIWLEEKNTAKPGEKPSQEVNNSSTKPRAHGQRGVLNHLVMGKNTVGTVVSSLPTKVAWI